MVLYGWRSLEATVTIRLKKKKKRIRLKARGRGLRSKIENTRKLLTKGILIDKSSSKNLHAYTETKLHPRAKKFQSKTYQANSPTAQEHNLEH